MTGLPRRAGIPAAPVPHRADLPPETRALLDSIEEQEARAVAMGTTATEWREARVALRVEGDLSATVATGELLLELLAAGYTVTGARGVVEWARLLAAGSEMVSVADLVSDIARVYSATGKPLRLS